ncbi:P-loop containing nucleoside triphosphate hydrolase protein, partial [Bisporella sp. PMI_857]
DLIQGKGTGLFILLHGVPGIGKTATAEANAQANSKPLFKTTIGDLGMIPERLEILLREKFHLASIWDYILLLDEADTFFAQRSQADMATNKNTLVSVFLRVLDYYNSILFLTTNRASVLDEAFKSRIHYKIYYPDLTLEQTLDTWKLNINRVRRIEEQS